MAGTAGTAGAVLLIGLLGLGAAGAGAVAVQRRIYFPRWLAETDEAAAGRVPGLERWWWASPAGPVEAWYVPGQGTSPDAPGPLVVFAHGNAETVDQWPEVLSPYTALGVSLLLPEYPGYGRSAGRPSQPGIVETGLAFVARARSRPEVDPGRVVYHGRSIGGGVVCALAAEAPPRALILESTFTRLSDRAWEYTRLPRSLVRDPFDSLAVVASFPGPVLVMHGTADTTIPFHHGEALRDAAADARFERYDGVGHNDIPRGDRYWTAIRGLLGDAGVLGAS